MKRQSSNLFFIVFHITLGIVVLIQSLFAVFHSLHEPLEGHVGKVLPWLAGLEAIAAILFLIPQTVKVGGWILLGIFTIAFVVHGPIRGMPLLVYAAGVLLVMSRKQVTRETSSVSDNSAD